MVICLRSPPPFLLQSRATLRKRVPKQKKKEKTQTKRRKATTKKQNMKAKQTAHEKVKANEERKRERGKQHPERTGQPKVHTSAEDTVEALEQRTLTGKSVLPTERDKGNLQKARFAPHRDLPVEQSHPSPLAWSSLTQPSSQTKQTNQKILTRKRKGRRRSAKREWHWVGGHSRAAESHGGAGGEAGREKRERGWGRKAKKVC